MNRVAVTGLGCVSGLGRGVHRTWQALMQRRSGIRVTRITSPPNPYAAEVPLASIDEADCVQPENLVDDRTFKSLDRFCKLAIIAASEAMTDASLPDAKYDPADIAVLLGSSTGGLLSLEQSYSRVYRENAARVHPMTIPRFMGSSPASAITQSFGITGPAWCVSSACSSSAHAISEAAWHIRTGRVKVVIAGGSEASLSFGHIMAWQCLGALAKDTCRPFSIGRTGMALAEGAAVLVLEDYAFARRRGARIYGEVLGCGYSTDAFHLTQPKPEGAVQAMLQALKESDLSADTRLLISTHGTGTLLNDASEAEALRRLFADDVDRHLAIATKSAHGHMIGATGAMEVLIGLLALKERVAPPVCNFLGPDPACRLPLVVGDPMEFRGATLLSNSFAFGGLNSALVISGVEQWN
jgi:nodulation protein E